MRNENTVFRNYVLLDPRVERTKKHQLTDILVIAILAIIAGSQGWEDIENYGISKQKWLEEFLVSSQTKLIT